MNSKKGASYKFTILAVFQNLWSKKKKKYNFVLFQVLQTGTKWQKFYNFGCTSSFADLQKLEGDEEIKVNCTILFLILACRVCARKKYKAVSDFK